MFNIDHEPTVSESDVAEQIEKVAVPCLHLLLHLIINLTS